MNPLDRIPEWHTQAACAGDDAALFHNRGNESLGQRRERERAARQVCLSCPVRRRCLDEALQAPPKYQINEIQGGYTPLQRKRERAHRLAGGQPRYDLDSGVRPKYLVGSGPAAAAVRDLLRRGHTIDSIAARIGRSSRCVQRLARRVPHPQVETTTARAVLAVHAELTRAGVA